MILPNSSSTCVPGLVQDSDSSSFGTTADNDVKGSTTTTTTPPTRGKDSPQADEPNQPPSRSLLKASLSSDATIRPLDRNESASRLRSKMVSRSFSSDSTHNYSFRRSDSNNNMKGLSVKKEANESSRRLSLLGGNPLSLLVSRSHHKEDSSGGNSSNHERRQLSRNQSGSNRSLSKAFGDSKRSLHRSFSGLSNSTRSLTRSLSKCSLHSLSSRDESAAAAAAAAVPIVPPPKEPYLLDQLGGMIVLKSILQEFGRRVIRDPLLQPFLSEADPRALHAHHERFFAMAFTEINIPQTAWIVQKSHQALIADKGLNEEHYDAFQQHLVDCLSDRGFEFAILDKVLRVLAPMRDIFKDAAEGKITSSSSSHITITVQEEEEDLEQSFSLE